MADITINGVCEHDIDLLFLEEFVASDEFLDWFLGRIQIPTTAKLLEAARSVSTSTGESDLELMLEGPSGVIKVLIENKIACPYRKYHPAFKSLHLELNRFNFNIARRLR